MGDPVAIGKIAAGAAGNLVDEKLNNDNRIVKSRCVECRKVIDVPQWIVDLGLLFHETLIERGEEGLSGSGACEECGIKMKARQDAEALALLDLTTSTWTRLNKLRRRYKAQEVEASVIARELEMLPDDFIAANVLMLDSYRRELRGIWKHQQAVGSAVDTDLE